MNGHDVVVCFGFEADRVRRQPWHVARGIATGLTARGRRVTLLTDARLPPNDEDFTVCRLPALVLRGEPAPALRAALDQCRPDRVFVVIGIHELLWPRRFRLHQPTYLIVAAQAFSLGEILSAPLVDLWRERTLLALVLLNALIPASVLRRGFARSGASGLVFLSEAARRRFAAFGLHDGVTLRPQVEPPVSPVARLGTEVPVILYTGPPLALRGADLALETFERARADGLDARLQLLLRPDGAPSAMRRFIRRVERSRWRSSIELVTDMLSAGEMRRYQALADVHLLPFRLTVSDAPLVVIEAGLTGRPVVTLETAGVSEYARTFGGLVAASPDELPEALRLACRRPRRHVPIDDWTGWARATSGLADLAPLPANRLRTIALIGIDGAGKTTLARRLRDRLAANGLASTHVWSRYRNYLSKPLLAFARLTGHNRKLWFGGIKVGVHDFENWLARPFLLLQRIDLVLDAWLRIRPAARQDLIVMDRCVLDQIVDVAADTGLTDEIVERLAPRLFDLLPQPATVVLVDREPLLIGRDRLDALMDPKLLRRRAIYRRLAARLSLPIVDNDGSLEAADRRLDRIVGIEPATDGCQARR